MAEEENPEDVAYTITKYPEDGEKFTEHSSRNYTGRASVVYANGDRYEGYFKDGLREGQGTYYYFKEEGCQNFYQGEWLQNKKHGFGNMIYGGIGEYYGQFENGKRNGQGWFRYVRTGNSYNGNWVNGQKQGYGEFVFDKTKMKIAGNWEKGKMNQGRWVFPNGVYFEGPFYRNYPKGEGVWHFLNGNTIKGSFIQEQKDAPPVEEGEGEGEGFPEPEPEPEPEPAENPEGEGEEGQEGGEPKEPVEPEPPEDPSQITVVHWTTDPQLGDPSRELYKVEPTLELTPGEEERKEEEGGEGVEVEGGEGSGENAEVKQEENVDGEN